MFDVDERERANHVWFLQQRCVEFSDFCFFLAGKGESSYVGVNDAREREEKARKREENWSLSERPNKREDAKAHLRANSCGGDVFRREMRRTRVLFSLTLALFCASSSFENRTSGVTAPETGSLSAFSPNRAFVCIKFYATTKTHIYFFHHSLRRV